MRNTPLMNRVREMILSEELRPGTRVTEEGLAAQLGVSRTPVRRILPILASEGFLRTVGRRGYEVATYSEHHGWEALELRALLEGHAARLLAQQGASDTVLGDLDECLAEGDRLFDHAAKRSFSREEEQRYERFHNVLIEAAGLPLLKMFVDRLNLVPFVSPGVIVFDHASGRRSFDLLFLAHGCHHSIVQAIRMRDGGRADGLMREHAYQQRLSMFERRLRRGGTPPEAPPETAKVPQRI
jgi:GntR family transcriptional regulator of vanillate catabolism